VKRGHFVRTSANSALAASDATGDAHARLYTPPSPPPATTRRSSKNAPQRASTSPVAMGTPVRSARYPFALRLCGLLGGATARGVLNERFALEPGSQSRRPRPRRNARVRRKFHR